MCLLETSLLLRIENQVRFQKAPILRDGKDIASEAVNADSYRSTHWLNLDDRFAAKSHAPDLAFVLDHPDRLDVFRLEVVVLAGDLDGALAADLFSRRL